MLNGWTNLGMDFFSRNKLEKKYHGLVNQGATCYLNSVLQVLFMTEDFRESVKRNNAGKEHIDKELQDLFRDLERHDGYTYKITNKLKIKNVYEQRDAAEHYEKILRLTSPEASQMFHGKLINRTTCKQCNSETKSPAGFWHLPLPLVNNNNEYSVEKGIEEYFHASEISGDDQMYCETCDEKCDAVLEVNFPGYGGDVRLHRTRSSIHFYWRNGTSFSVDCVVEDHPKVLALLLKRFEFDYSYMTYVKINQPVNVANTLQLSGNQLYELYAIVEHFGELRYGHYVSTVRSQDDGKWYRFDDSNVSKVDLHIASTLEGSKSAYLLFYQKQQETPLVNTTNGETTYEEQIPDENQMENEEKRATLKRPGSFDEKKQENKVKKSKPEQSVEEHGSDQRGQECKDLDICSSSSSQQMFDPYMAEFNRESECKVGTEFSDHKQDCLKEESNGQVEQGPQLEISQPFAFEKKEQLSQMYPDPKKWDKPETERYCNGDMMKTNCETLLCAVVNTEDELQTNLTEAQKQGCSLKSCSQQNVQDEGTLCETSENCCEDQGGCEVRHSCSDVKTAMIRENEVMTETEETQLIQNDSNREKCERLDHFVTETVNAKDGKDGGGENGVQYRFDNRKNIQATMKELEKRSQVESQEGCSNKSDTEQHLVPLCENNGEYEDQQSCPNVNPKTAMGQNDHIEQAKQKWDRPANSGTYTLVNAKDSKDGGDNGGCEGLQSCSDVHIAIDKQEQGSDREETMFRNNAGTIDTWLKDDCDNRFQDISPDDSSLGWKTHCHVEKNNAKEELLDKSDHSTQDTESSELSMMHTLTGSVHVKLEEEANKSCLLGESSQENDYEKLEKGYYGISYRIHDEGFDQDKSDVHMDKYHPEENRISVDVQSENMNITATYKHDPSYSTSVIQKDFTQSFSTMQKDEAQIEKNDQNIDLENLEITEKSDFRIEGQAGRNINAHEKLTVRAKEEKKLLTKYDLYLETIKPKKSSVIQPVPVATTLQTEYPSSRGNTEGFRQESVVHTSCSIHTSEKSEMGSNLQGQVTYAGREFERVDVIIEGDVEFLKITPKKIRE